MTQGMVLGQAFLSENYHMSSLNEIKLELVKARARHESGYLRRYLRVHLWENPCKRITHVQVTRRLQNPRVQVSILDHMQPVWVTRTTRVCFSKHSHATTTTRHMGSFKNEVG